MTRDRAFLIGALLVIIATLVVRRLPGTAGALVGVLVCVAAVVVMWKYKNAV
jgi:hypothetical protein